MPEPAYASPCGYCGTPVLPDAGACPRCGIRFVDISRHHWAYDAKEAVLDRLDRAAGRARTILRKPESRKIVGGVLAVGAVLGTALIGRALRRKQKD